MASVNDNKKDAKTFRTTSFRNAMTAKEGTVPGRVVMGRVVNVNVVNYTVDVRSAYDRKIYPNIQVSSPYLHHSNGEGFSCLPEVGASCAVCLPSDSAPPFVLCFVMVFQKIDDATTPETPTGTASHGAKVKYPSAVTFSGGRPRGKPGDLMLRGRDGNFVILHRGGVLQVGSTELAQRLYIPLDNRILDISGSYGHHNTGGSVLWGLADASGDQSVTHVETFRVYADDKFADIRISKGHVLNPVPPEQPLPGELVYEVAIAPGGFNAQGGDMADSGTAKKVVYQLLVDRAGNTFQTISGDLFLRAKKTVSVFFDNTVLVNGKTDMSVTFKTGIDIDGGAYTHIKGKLVRLGKGDQAVARKGDFVSTKVLIPVKALIAFPAAPSSGPCTISFLESLGGVITSGNETVKA